MQTITPTTEQLWATLQAWHQDTKHSHPWLDNACPSNGGYKNLWRATCRQIIQTHQQSVPLQPNGLGLQDIEEAPCPTNREFWGVWKNLTSKVQALAQNDQTWLPLWWWMVIEKEKIRQSVYSTQSDPGQHLWTAWKHMIKHHPPPTVWKGFVNATHRPTNLQTHFVQMCKNQQHAAKANEASFLWAQQMTAWMASFGKKKEEEWMRICMTELQLWLCKVPVCQKAIDLRRQILDNDFLNDISWKDNNSWSTQVSSNAFLLAANIEHWPLELSTDIAKTFLATQDPSGKDDLLWSCYEDVDPTSSSSAPFATWRHWISNVDTPQSPLQESDLQQLLELSIDNDYKFFDQVFPMLPPTQQEQAVAEIIKTMIVHPALDMALNLWPAASQQDNLVKQLWSSHLKQASPVLSSMLDRAALSEHLAVPQSTKHVPPSKKM